ncbi:DUF2891 family protein [Terriglobus roseus]|uniref:DUF2891 domain-containing protein n=1 Tax=Terriglobus roseus TaxID=392734 RepID=A0A1H4JVP6_9BACT|nr:DUF2891 family protein [Terriglobus roseus]SEB50253.1 Protein of unknown function [Terriglobus roseus]
MTARRIFLAAALVLCAGPRWIQAQHRTPDAKRLAKYSKTLPTVTMPVFGLEQATALSAWPLACLDHPQPAPEGSQYLWSYSQRPELATEYDKTHAFFGCYDWHSAVNSTWMMVALSKDYPDLPLRRLMQERLVDHLGEKNIAGELQFFKQAKQFEKPYGYAWLLKLHAELRTWNDPEAAKLATNLQPLQEFFAGKLIAYYDALPVASRAGVHPNTAMSMLLVLDALHAVPNDKLQTSVDRNAKRLFAADHDCPTAFEPGGTEFLSPCLVEAQLMSRVLTHEEYPQWLADFLVPFDAAEFQTLAKPFDVSKLTDKEEFAGKSHLIGLAFARAYAMIEIADALPANDPRVPVLRQLATINASQGMKGLPDAGYLGSHWLGTYAVLYLRAARHVPAQPVGPATPLPPVPKIKPSNEDSSR